MMVKVRRAVGTTGSRNALTPLLTASTPVMAVHPLAKAWRISQPLGAAAAIAILGRGSTSQRMAASREGLENADRDRQKQASEQTDK